MIATDAELIDACCRNTIGKPSSLCDWRELLRVRDAVDQVLNNEVNRRQEMPR